MIKNVIDLLKADKHYGVSERVEIAKGKFSISYSLRDGIEKIKRLWLIRKSK